MAEIERYKMMFCWRAVNPGSDVSWINEIPIAISDVSKARTCPWGDVSTYR